MLRKEALKHVGSLSNTSKMPGKSIGIQAKYCKTGSKLAKVEGSVCALCYGKNGWYNMPNVKRAEDLRRELMLNDPKWEDSIVTLIINEKEPYFRWFDNGDLQSVENLEKIVRVCERTPGVKHWLPTKEYGMVNDFLISKDITWKELPSNMVIRPSDYMMGGKPPEFRGKFWRMNGMPTSTATFMDKNGKPEVIHGDLCKAKWNDGECGSCRACWMSEVSNVSYPNQRQKIKQEV